MDIAVGSAAINLFRGSVKGKEIAVANPVGFSEKSIFAVDGVLLDVSLKALLKHTLRISDASMDKAVISIIRNKDGVLNLTAIQKQLQGGQSGTAPAVEEPAHKPAPAPETQEKPETVAESENVSELPKVQIDQLSVETLFEFIDHKQKSGTAKRLGLDLNIAASDIVNFEQDGENGWGNLHITGGLHEKPELFTVDIKAQVAPLTDVKAPSFKVDGTIASLNLEQLGSIQEEMGISGSSADLKVELNVEKGVFQKGSKLIITLRDARLTGKLSRKHKKVKLPPDTSVTIPVKGSLAEPKINFVQAVTASVLRNIKNNPDYLLDNISVDGKSLKDRLKKALD
jgi:hypothetical protein